MTQSLSTNLYVAIGASSGGIHACKEFLKVTPTNTNNSYIIVMHLIPNNESSLQEIFQTVTDMPVIQVVENEPIKPNCVYVIAPNSLLEVEGNILVPREMPKNKQHYLQKPIDRIFETLARNKFEKSVGIILSGTGSDGTSGSYEIKDKMGSVITQTPSSADYPEMPQSAISSGNVDQELEISQMPLYLEKYAKLSSEQPYQHPITDNYIPQTASQNDIKRIYQILEERYKIDLMNFYKQGTLIRRSARRMQLLKIQNLTKYVDYIEQNHDESQALYNDLLIGVTKFFRDLHVWKDLEQVTIPKMIQNHKKDAPFRIWVPGCATGEEAYGLAILLNEQLKEENSNSSVQIFATDISEPALKYARQAIYPKEISRTIPSDKLKNYFEDKGDCFKVKRKIREQVTFSHHNLLSDPPFTSMDLISCRNLLIYFQPEAQQRVMELFHFALRPTGFLVLGTSETTGQKNHLFEIESGINKIFRPVLSKRMRYKHLKNFIIGHGPQSASNKGIHLGQRIEKTIDQYIEKYVLNKHTHSCVAISESFEIYAFYGDTTSYLTPPTGGARMGILSWAKPGIYARLRSALDHVKSKNEKIEITGIQIASNHTKELVEFIIEPISPLPGNLKMYLVTFRKNAVLPHSQDFVSIPKEKADYVKQLEDELKITQDELENTVSQFKNSLDEYQTNHEELVTLNEELQSNNEEIEASKEELQSLIEELTALNQQNKSKNEELQLVFNDLNNLLISTKIPIIFLDRRMCIRRFTPSISDIFHIADSDLGRPFQEIKEKFKSHSLIPDIEKVQVTNQSIKKEIQTNDGKFFNLEILPYRTEDGSIDGTCLSFLDINFQKKALLELNKQKNFSELIIDSTLTGLVLLEHDLTISMINKSFCNFFHLSKQDVCGKKLFELNKGMLASTDLYNLSQKILASKLTNKTYVLNMNFNGENKTFRVIAKKIYPSEQNQIILSIQDVTTQRESRKILKEKTTELKKEQKRKDEFLAMLSHELRNPLNAILNGVMLLELKAKGDKKTLSITEMMKRQSNRIVHILDELLEITRISTGKIQLKLTPVNFTEVISAAIETLTPSINQKQHKIIYNYSQDDSFMVCADRSRLIQITENLINNAIKYTPNKGTIWITLESDNIYTRLKVKDNGIGINSNSLDKVFDLFVQGKSTTAPSEKGLGLGLSLVKNLTEAHKGKIFVKSEGENKGSEFIVELQSFQDKNNLKQKSKNYKSDSKVRILLIDDEVDSSKILKDILNNAGFAVKYSISSSQAIDDFKSFKPDVTIVDMALPEMDGYTLDKKLREEFPYHNSLMIALSGLKKDKNKFESSGFSHYIMKPAKVNELINIIKSR